MLCANSAGPPTRLTKIATDMHYIVAVLFLPAQLLAGALAATTVWAATPAEFVKHVTGVVASPESTWWQDLCCETIFTVRRRCDETCVDTQACPHIHSVISSLCCRRYSHSPPSSVMPPLEDCRQVPPTELLADAATHGRPTTTMMKTGCS